MHRAHGIVFCAGLLHAISVGAADNAIEARFRGCEASGWCHFWFERPGADDAALHRILPDGVTVNAGDARLRDRLNALLSDMIHQHKRIELHRLRARDGGWAATVTITGVALAEDPVLQELQSEASRQK